MECIEARALKPSFLSQMAKKANSQVYYNDDGWCLTGVNNVVTDDFPVEDLLNLDLPEKDIQELCFSQEDEEDASQKGNSIYSSSSSSTFSGADDFDTVSAAELAVPVDDLENLEWLSQFVNDSTSEVSLLCSAGSFMAQTGVFSVNRSHPVHRPPQRNPVRYFPVPVPVKARSKRPRPACRPWYLASPALSSVDSSSTTSSSHGSSALPPLVFASPVHDTEWLSSVEKPAAKKQKRKTEADTGPVSSRRCTHCQVQKTPQWRTGPLGPKTLCNACGVRFKSGRLFPEYRPAFSPTYSKELHSNSHRKVLEMRQKKEKIVAVESDSTPSIEPDLTPAVQSQ